MGTSETGENGGMVTFAEMLNIARIWQHRHITVPIWQHGEISLTSRLRDVSWRQQLSTNDGAGCEIRTGFQTQLWPWHAPAAVTTRSPARLQITTVARLVCEGCGLGAADQRWWTVVAVAAKTDNNGGNRSAVSWHLTTSGVGYGNRLFGGVCGVAFSCGFVTFSCHFVGKGKARDKLQKLNSVELIVRFGRLSVVAFEIGCVFCLSISWDISTKISPTFVLFCVYVDCIFT